MKGIASSTGLDAEEVDIKEILKEEILEENPIK